MGLFYLMPIATEEVDHVTSIPHSEGPTIEVKSYGPPTLFWYYLIVIIMVLIIMFAAIWHPMLTMIRGDDLLNKFIAVTVLFTLVVLPLVVIGFFYYQKRIRRTPKFLTISHHIFGINIATTSFELAQLKLSIEHQMDGENYARQSGRQDLRAFYNQGHYYFYAQSNNQTKIMIDRNQRKTDLVKLGEVLQLNNVQVSSSGMTNPLDV